MEDKDEDEDCKMIRQDGDEHDACLIYGVRQDLTEMSFVLISDDVLGQGVGGQDSR